MYQKHMAHAVSCGDHGIICDSIKVKHEYSLTQIPLISGGYYSKEIGKKWCELTIEASVSDSDRKYYDSFLKFVADGPVNLVADSEIYSKCVLVESSMTCVPDSRIYRFMMKFRSVTNG